MSLESEALEKWMNANQSAFDAASLQIPPCYSQYLGNRLIRAFQLGMEAGRKIEEE